MMENQQDKRLEWYEKAVSYTNIEQLTDCLRQIRMNRKTNDSPYMDNALLNLIQLLEADFIPNNPLLADSVLIGGCGSCKNKRKHQKCSCCRRNRYLKDNYEESEEIAE